MIIICRQRDIKDDGEKLEEWFSNNHLSYQVLSPPNLSRTLLLKILQLSERGFDSILLPESYRNKKGCKLKKLNVEECSVSKLIDIVLTSPQLLRTPIAFDEKHLFVGYNAEELRIFLPSDFRKVERQLIKEYQ